MIDWTIIDKNLEGQADVHEKEELERWLAESPAHRDLYKRIEGGAEYDLTEEQYRAWADEFDGVLETLKVGRRRKKRLRLARVSVAAAAMLAAAVLIPNFLSLPVGEETHTVVPGSPKAQLQLASGEWIGLEADESKSIETGENVEISAADNTLVYNSTETTAMQYNILSTQRGGEWTVVLADGTKVYLNSASMLRYPVAFNSATRRVVLQGEAYFEVAPDADKPFIIETEGVEIKVLGTSFNVNAYPHHDRITTTLVEGRVEISRDDDTYLLAPGQQLVYDKTDGTGQVREVDTELYSSWKDGFYKFRQTRMEDIMNALALWYDVDVVYADPLAREIKFTSSGPILRYDDIASLLSKFELTDNVRFDLDGKTLTVSRK